MFFENVLRRGTFLHLSPTSVVLHRYSAELTIFKLAIFLRTRIHTWTYVVTQQACANRLTHTHTRVHAHACIRIHIMPCTCRWSGFRFRCGCHLDNLDTIRDSLCQCHNLPPPPPHADTRTYTDATVDFDQCDSAWRYFPNWPVKVLAKICLSCKLYIICCRCCIERQQRTTTTFRPFYRNGFTLIVLLFQSKRTCYVMRTKL